MAAPGTAAAAGPAAVATDFAEGAPGGDGAVPPAGFAAAALDEGLDDAASGAVLAGASPPASSVRITMPSLTLSPSLTRRSLTTPAAGEGTSIVALSDSSVTSESSAFTVSPGFTRTSMTGMSLKSPMSGTLTWIMLTTTFRAALAPAYSLDVPREVAAKHPVLHRERDLCIAPEITVGAHGIAGSGLRRVAAADAHQCSAFRYPFDVAVRARE